MSVVDIPSNDSVITADEIRKERRQITNLVNNRPQQQEEQLTNKICPGCRRVEMRLHLQDTSIAGYEAGKLYYICPQLECNFKTLVLGQEFQKNQEGDKLLREDVLSDPGRRVCFNLDKRKDNRRKPKFESVNNQLDEEDLFLRQQGYMI